MEIVRQNGVKLSTGAQIIIKTDLFSKHFLKKDMLN